MLFISIAALVIAVFANAYTAATHSDENTEIETYWDNNMLFLRIFKDKGVPKESKTPFFLGKAAIAIAVICIIPLFLVIIVRPVGEFPPKPEVIQRLQTITLSIGLAAIAYASMIEIGRNLYKRESRILEAIAYSLYTMATIPVAIVEFTIAVLLCIVGSPFILYEVVKKRK